MGMPGTDAATKRACDEGRFTPWGRGTHVCVGRRFANMQITLFVAHVLRKFDAELVDPSAHIAVDPRQAGFFISRPTHPVWMKLHRRSSGDPKQIVSVEAELHDPSAQMLQIDSRYMLGPSKTRVGSSLSVFCEVRAIDFGSWPFKKQRAFCCCCRFAAWMRSLFVCSLQRACRRAGHATPGVFGAYHVPRMRADLMVCCLHHLRTANA